ncbi:MAG: transporter substrate-binding domain-containing protein [Oligoflexia bacterium]|nr:transporter substrate-binding domain-containing protein [Oligoflexia bacterium]
MSFNITMGRMFILLFFLSVTIPMNVKGEDTLSVCADIWMPFNGDPKSSTPGFMVEVIKKIYAEFDVKIDYRLMPWARAIKEVRTGSCIALIGAYKGDAPDFIFPQEYFSLGTDGFFVLSKKSDWQYQGIDSLKGMKLGCILDYSYGEEVNEYIKSYPKQVDCIGGIDPLLQNISKLSAGRIDILVEDIAVFNWILDEKDMTGKIVLAGTGQKKMPLYIAFSPKAMRSNIFATFFDRGMRKLSKSGDLAALKKKYKITQ